MRLNIPLCRTNPSTWFCSAHPHTFIIKRPTWKNISVGYCPKCISERSNFLRNTALNGVKNEQSDRRSN